MRWRFMRTKSPTNRDDFCGPTHTGFEMGARAPHGEPVLTIKIRSGIELSFRMPTQNARESGLLDR